MKTNNEYMKNNILTLAVQGALIAMFALPLVSNADEVASDETTALTHPTNVVEIGAIGVSQSTAKFGEYNGLDDSGLYGIANVDVRGGTGYDGGDSTTRWQIKGVDLGTTSRSLGAAVENQGQWNIGINFDELRHNITDTYQTPYLGNMGGNSFTLPAGFNPLTNTATTDKAKIAAALHSEDIHTTRENTSITAGYVFNPQWDVKLDINHLNQTGAKLMSFGAAGINGSSGEVLSVLPNPTNYTTDTVNLALNWKGDKAHLNTSYFGSYFRNEFDRVSFQTYMGTLNTQNMSTAPSNDFHQFNLNGGYAFNQKTKLAGAFSYGIGTQDDAFVVDPAMMLTTPQRTSADGRVITTHADLKLTDQTFNKLTLTAGLKYDERDNKTPSSIYNFNAISGSANNRANYPNIPNSNRKTQFELAGDYRLDNKQHMRLAYNRENIQRWCNDYATGGGVYYASNGTTVTSNIPYTAGTACVVAPSSKEDKISATYKLNATENLHLNAGYSYGKRDTDFNELARTAFVEVVNGVPGLNGGDFIGFHPFFEADRIQQMLKGGIDWQVNDKLSLNVNGKYTDDNYDTLYGFQNGNSWSLSADASYRYSENGSLNAYITKEQREREMTNKQGAATASATRVLAPATATWTNNLKDEDITLGLGAKQEGLMGGKLGFSGDLTYSLGKTNYDTELNYTGLSSGGQTCSGLNVLSCGSLPDVRNRMIQFKLSGDYKVNKNGTVGLGYLYQNLSADDYYYNAYQIGFTPTKNMPTNQQPGSYSVHAVAATYIYKF